MNRTGLLLALGLMALTAAAQDVPRPSQQPATTPLLELARKLGRAAGNAEFCIFKEEEVENFIVYAHARLDKETDDKILLAGSRVEFNTHAAYGRSRGPDEPCESYLLPFRKLAREIR